MGLKECLPASIHAELRGWWLTRCSLRLTVRVSVGGDTGRSQGG